MDYSPKMLIKHWQSVSFMPSELRKQSSSGKARPSWAGDENDRIGGRDGPEAVPRIAVTRHLGRERPSHLK